MMSAEMSMFYLGVLGLAGFFGSLIVSMIDRNAERYADSIVSWFYKHDKKNIKCDCIGYRIKGSCRHGTKIAKQETL